MKYKSLAYKLSAVLLATLMIVSAVKLPVFAAESLPAISATKYLRTYAYESSGKCYAYTDATLKTKTGGYINNASDECQIQEIKGAAVKIKYPRDAGGYRTAWFYRANFTYFDLAKDNPKVVFSATGKAYTYIRKNSSTVYGYLEKGDKCYLLRGNESSDWLQLIYPAGSVYKMAWVKGQDVKDMIWPKTTGIKLNETSFTLMGLGSTKTLSATVTPSNSTQGVTWKSDNNNIATVSNGVVKAVASGSTTITATSGSKSAKAKVSVIVPPSGISLDKTMHSFNSKGAVVKLTATVRPEGASDKNVVWRSNNTSVATVDRSGVVTSVNNGQATITAETSNGIKATALINVDIVPTGIDLDEDFIVLESIGSSQQLKASVLPYETKDKTVLWSSTDDSVATVTNNGVVVITGYGEAEIIAETVNGIEAIATVVCFPPDEPGIIEPEYIELDESDFELELGKTRLLTATIEPEDAENNHITWESMDVSVASVTPEGVVKAVGVGETDIVASTMNGLSAVATVWVIDPANPDPFIEEPDYPTIIEPESIELNESEFALDEIGSTKRLIATVLPDEAEDKSVIWESSDETIVIVDEDGMVTSVGSGEAEIYATTINGLMAVATVFVSGQENPQIEEPVSIGLNTRLLNLNYLNDEEQLIATVLPESAADGSIVWTSDDETIATVDESGYVRATGNGSTYITAETENGLMAAAKVTVSGFPVQVASVQISQSSVTLRPGKSFTLQANIFPSDASNKKTSWKSSDSNIVTVNDSGTLKGVKAGTATVTVTTNDNQRTASCKVTVIPDSTLQAVDANISDKMAFSAGYPLRGKITSNYTISKVTVGIYSSAGKKIVEKTVNPNSKSFKLNKLKSDIDFKSLKIGTYYYRIVATDQLIKNKTLMNTKFKVLEVFRQNGSYKWCSHPYGKVKDKNGKWKTATISSGGCGVVSIVNAVYYLNGEFIDPGALADYSVKKGYRINNVGTKDGLVKAICNESSWSKQYGIKFIHNVSNSKGIEGIKKDLQKGYVAVIHVDGHFMSVVDYDAESDKYLLLDSSKGPGWISTDAKWISAKDFTGSKKLKSGCVMQVIGKK